MKKIALFALMLSALFSRSQIQNPGFEMVTANKPDNWNLGFYSTYFIKDTTASYTGSKAAYIKAFAAQSYSVQGAVLGLFPASGKPISLEGWYKCNLQPGDSLVFSPYVYQTNIYSAKAQGYAFTTTSTAVYKQFSAAINYAGFPGNTVGTAFISIYLSGPTTDAEGIFIPQAGTWAILDDLSLTYPVNTGISNAVTDVTVEKIYPQPAADYAYVVYTLSETVSCSLKLFDVTGKEVKTIIANEQQSPGRYKAELDLSGVGTGIYFVKLSAGDKSRVAKLIKE